MSDIRVVVGLDFGTTYSGFTYCHVKNRSYTTNDQWPGSRGQCQYKTNTVLKYDDTFTNVELWGCPALSKRPNRRLDRNQRENVVELFKLHLGNLQAEIKEKYTISVNYKKAITDYLREIGKHIKEIVTGEWEIDVLKNVLLVLTVPAEYTQREKAIMRECAFNAGLISEKESKRLEFTTEPEAAAIYCMDNVLDEHGLSDSGTTFMIVDCGGGTVDLTTRKLLNGKQLSEVTERAGDYCGSAFIDAEFLDYLRRKFGDSAMNLLRNNFYGQMQYMVQEFCQHVKFEFTGDDTTFGYKMDLTEVSPVLLQYVNDEVKQQMEEVEWLIELDYKKIKSMFDPVIERILRMIRVQLDNCHEKGSKCSAMLLVGGFSQSEYLQKRVKEEFQYNRDHPDINISVPTIPIAAVSRGAAIYGLGFKNMDDDELDGLMFAIDSRILKLTYGIKILKPGDPKFRFHLIAKRGTKVQINEEFSVKVRPSFPFQTCGVFEIYCTREYDAKYCDKRDEPGIKLFGKLKIDWPDVHLGLERPTTFKLAFGQMEITAKAYNETNGQNYQTSFEIDAEEE
ncbi:hypothetical protein C1645_766521 [Glomus cerebriforme]|uniref:Actin-like ATPase domain-containing protein n=1 Tax=Glomus cerebriforme TaxID=658196 RepID=A0A397T6G4_9GLOM|nr:hypothetical protein C1645_766521 [Glomus cerebriforme]